MWKWTLVILLVVFSVSPASAFDGLRKGFVLGGGLGIAPTSSWDVGFDDDSNVGTGGNLFIGYGWNEFNMIVYEGNFTIYNTTLEDHSAVQGFTGVAWYHFFGPIGRSFFTVAGLGIYRFETFPTVNNSGTGALLGIGYDLARHIQAAVYLSAGKTSESSHIDGQRSHANVDWDHTHINVLVSAVAF